MEIFFHIFARIPERDPYNIEEDEFEMEGGEDDLDEFERAFPEVPQTNGKTSDKRSEFASIAMHNTK